MLPPSSGISPAPSHGLRSNGRWFYADPGGETEMPPSDLCLLGELGGQGRREGCILRAEGRGILLCAP